MVTKALIGLILIAIGGYLFIDGGLSLWAFIQQPMEFQAVRVVRMALGFVLIIIGKFIW